MTASTDTNRIDQSFSRLRAAGRKALIAYITAGYPAPTRTVDIMHALVAGGADILELGIPFSDPMADGPVIQRASEAALAAGMRTGKVFEQVREFRQKDQTTAIVLMTYLNPIEVMGYVRFAEQAASAGVDGVLVVDLPPEEADALRGELTGRRLAEIFLASPTTDAARLDLIRENASGFVYYVSVKGVTGKGQIDTADVSRQVEKLRADSKLPVGVGFAVRDAATAAQLAGVCDGVVVGSAIVERAGADVASDRELSAFVKSLRDAMDQAVGA
ncbi:MAG: tryptophan synthase subunit alpha [Gammaproteobacteria bacterium]|nr:tryptophan synthase subunit alpha [Gammaproteobacteria bacterium]